MVAAGSVLVMNIDADLLADSSAHIKLYRTGVAHQIGCHVHLDAIDSDDPVRGEILAFEMRVDRHVVLGATSTNRRDKVNRSDPASLLDQVSRVVGKKQVHIACNPP